MRHRRETDTKKINGVLLLLLLIVCCFCLILGLDYTIDHFDLNKSFSSSSSSSSSSTKIYNTDNNNNNNNNNNKVLVQGRDSFLHQKFRYHYGQLIRRKLEKKDSKLPSDMQVLTLLSEVYSSHKEHINFIQVGACDGNFLASNDPIQKLLHNEYWHGVLMEPVPLLFAKLQKNVEAQIPEFRQRLFLMNAALSDTDGWQNFYIVNEKFAKEKPQETHALKYQIGSFDKNHITKHLIKLYRRNDLQHDVDYYIDTISIRGATPDTVIQEFMRSKLAVRNGTIDVLLIDAEGYDFMVLKSFMKMLHTKPVVIIYENLHLQQEDQQEAENLLVSHGYTVWPVGWNSIGVKIADF